MSFHPSGNSREQILLIGSWGSGKSYAWLCTARRSPESHFYVIDTTWDAERMVEGEGLTNVTIQHVDTWDEWKETAERFRTTATRDDWLVVDLISDLWGRSQDAYSQKAFGLEVDDWFMSAKKEAIDNDTNVGGIIAGSHGENWGMINRLYQSVMMTILRFPGHIFAIAPAVEVAEPNQSGKGGDTIELRQLFNRFKVKPAGQKNLGFQFHTILLMREKSKDSWIMDTVRDRNREKLTNQDVTDFSLNYLLKVAGWRP